MVWFNNYEFRIKPMRKHIVGEGGSRFKMWHPSTRDPSLVRRGIVNLEVDGFFVLKRGLERSARGEK